MRDTLSRYLALATQVVHVQSADGQSYFPDGELTDDKLQAHLTGKATYALNIVSKENTARVVVLDFDYHGNTQANPQDYLDGLQRAHRGLTDMGIRPLVSVSGRKGYGLWVVLSEPVPVNAARQFVRALKTKFMASLQFVDLRPDTDKATSAAQAVVKLPPCLHKATGKWSGFIEPTTAANYLNHPWLDNQPDTGAQVELIQQATLTSPTAFFKVLADLNSEIYCESNAQGRLPLTPTYEKAPQGYVSPCISGLVANGVPETLEYNTANLTLANYCRSAGLPDGQATQLATTMAEHSEGHPTGKTTVKAKLANFQSNHNRGEAFQCGFMLREDMKAAWGGRAMCNQCQIQPDAMGQNPVGDTAHLNSSEPADVVTQRNAVSQITAELDVAMDALAYAWANPTLIPNVRGIWPLWEVTNGENLPLLKLAAETLPKPSSAEFFRKFELWISANPKYDTPHAHHGAGRFITALSNRKVSRFAFEGAVARLQELEKRVALLAATHALTGNARTLSVNKLAADLKGIAEDTLKADQAGGTLSSLKDQLFSELTADHNSGIPTPFDGLNDLLHGGFKGGRMYVLVAPPKAGKTTLVATMMDYAAAQQHPVLYVGYEMARQQMVEYAMARKLEINSRWIETRSLTDDNAKALVHGMAEYLNKEGRYLEVWEAGAKTSIADMAAWVERVKTEHPDKTPLVVIDYLQLANTGDPDIDRHQSDTKRVTGLAVACKDLARKTGAAVMALSSITKSAETEGRNSGDLDETAARDSLAIIHAADGVMTLNAQPKRIETGRGDNKEVEYLDQWQVYADQMKVNGSDQGIDIERRAQDLVYDYPPIDLESPAKGIRARLSLKRHRGATGDVPLYYQRAYHKFIEVDLLPKELEPKADYTQGGTYAIQKYAKALGTTVPESRLDNHKVEAPRPPEKPAKVEVSTNTPPVTSGAPYTLYTDLQATKGALRQFVGRKVGVDLETTGLHPTTAQARLLQVSDGQTTAMVDLWAVGGLTALRDELMALDGVAHNAVFDMGFLHHANVPLMLDCTMLAHHVLTGKREKLKTLAQQYLGLELDKTEQVSDWSGDLTTSQLEYAALDPVACLGVWQSIDLSGKPSGAYALVKGAQPAIVQAHLAGMGLDVEGLTELSERLQARKAELEVLVTQCMGEINPASGKQLSEWLIARLGNKASQWPTTGTGQLKTSADELTANARLLEGEDRRVVDLLIELKDINKKLSSFAGSLADKVNTTTGRIHANYNLANTVTGRMSCDKPNLQQIPNSPEYRRLFRPEHGRKFVIADFGAIELRVAAVLAGATELIQAFNDGLDPHALTASKLLGVPVETVGKKSPERSMAKAVNFGLLYGQGAKGLQAYAANTFGVDMTIEDAQRYKDGWFKAYPAFGKWQAKVKRDTSRSLITHTPAGRPRQWPSAKDYKLTEALNTPVQGGGAEGLLAAMALLVPALAPFDAKLVAVVHDELIVDCDEKHASEVATVLVDSMRRGMCSVFPDMPTTDLVEPTIGDSWAAK